MRKPLSTVRRTVLSTTLPLLVGALVAGCSGGSSGGGGFSTASGVNSGNPAGTTSGTTGGSTSGSTGGTTSGSTAIQGPLASKAAAFETIMDAWHLGLGQVQDVVLDANGNPVRTGNAPSRCLWTGIYAASQAQRYRVTRDPDALRKMEAALQTLHDLHEITGKPGVVARGFDLPAIETNGWQGAGRLSQYNHNKGETSRDQYAGWFYGISMAYDLIQDATLKAALEADVRAVCDKLMGNDLKMETPWGPQNQVEVFFNLNPDDFYQDQINAQNWATVDDFPFNLITRSVPYSQPLADAIKTAPFPAIRAGEALRAVFFFTVAEQITADPRYTNYKTTLLHQRGFLRVIEDYSTIGDDLFNGRNQQVVEDTVRQLFLAVGHILQAYLQATGQSAIVTQLLVPLAVNGLSGWLADVLTDGLAWLQNPNNAGTLANVMQQARLGVLLLRLVGQNGLAQTIDDLLTRYGQNLNAQGLKDFGRTVRSHLGTNLTLLPMMAMMRVEPDVNVKAAYTRTLDRYWDYLKLDHNPMVNLVHAGFGVVAGPNDVPHTIEALQKFPVDMSMREIDNNNWPGLVVSPWPDRFGRVGNHALTPDYFPIDHRAPDIFPWRGHPRQIKSGSNNPSVRVAPLGYLSAYWLARDLGVITAAD